MRYASGAMIEKPVKKIRHQFIIIDPEADRGPGSDFYRVSPRDRRPLFR